MFHFFYLFLKSLTVSDYLRTNKSIFSNSTENFNGTSNANSELDNDEDIFDINGGRQSNASTSSKTKKSHSASNRTLNTSSMSSGYESSKLSASDTNQTINQLNGNLSSNSSSASNLNTLSNENVSCDSPELLIKTSSKRASTSGNNITKNFYGSSHNLKSGSGLHSSSSRARLAQENLQRLEREKDDLYELWSKLEWIIKRNTLCFLFVYFFMIFYWFYCIFFSFINFLENNLSQI